MLHPTHFALGASELISQIMMPLLKPHGITVFNYYKIYFDGTAIRLSTDNVWTEHFFKQKYFEKMARPNADLSKPLNYFIWMVEDSPEMLLDAALNFDTSNGISLAKRHPDSIEYFAFATKRNNTGIINNFYLNNLDLLEQYCLYFKEQAKPLLVEAEKNKILVINLQGDPSNLKLEQSQPIIKISNRQLACANLLIQGKKYKEIAKELNLSPRTVEQHLNILREKMACNNSIELVRKLSLIYKI